ncbi:drug/metabolite transporter [Lactarius quietus]|nr:drug/metabolite transporter [Lactarius quietus]
MNLSVKLLNGLDEPVPTLEMITCVCSVAYMYWKKIRDPFIGPKGVRTLLMFRGLTGFLGVSGVYFSLQYLSLSDATALSFLSPILTGFSGAVFLKETLSLREVLAGLCSFVGVILIARPQSLFGSLQMFSAPSEVTPTQRKLSVIAALIGVVGSTGAYTLIRGIRKRAHVLHSMMFFSSHCVLASTLGMILFKQPLVIPYPSSLVMLFLISIFIFFAQSDPIVLTYKDTFNMGLQRETAGRGTLAIYSSIVFAVVFESIVFHTTPSALSIIGTFIIVSLAIYITLTKKLVSQHDTTSERPVPNHDSNLEA